MKKFKLNIEVGKSYVDDVTKIAAALDPGVRFVESKIMIVKHKHLVESDKLVPEDVRTKAESKRLLIQYSIVSNLQQIDHPCRMKEKSLYLTFSCMLGMMVR